MDQRMEGGKGVGEEGSRALSPLALSSRKVCVGGWGGNEELVRAGLQGSYVHWPPPAFALVCGKFCCFSHSWI